MAPKRLRASSPTRNKPLPVRIVRRNANRLLLANRSVIKGRIVDLRGLEGFCAQEAFEAIKWDTFLRYSGSIQTDHIREFYAGYSFDEAENRIELQMYDNFYMWPLDDFCQILDLPRSSTKIYTDSSDLNLLASYVSHRDLIRAICHDDIDPETTFHINDQSLSENVKFWNKIVLANIFPRGGNFDRMAAVQAYLLYCLASRIEVDIGFIVVRRMQGVETTKRKMPYGLLLNRLFDHLQLPPCPLDDPGVAINVSIIRRMDLAKEAHRDRNKEKEVEGESSHAADEEDIQHEDEPYNGPMMYSLYQELREDIHDIRQRQIRMEDRQITVQQELQQIRQQLQQNSDDMRSFFKEFRQCFPFPPR